MIRRLLQALDPGVLTTAISGWLVGTSADTVLATTSFVEARGSADRHSATVGVVSAHSGSRTSLSRDP